MASAAGGHEEKGGVICKAEHLASHALQPLWRLLGPLQRIPPANSLATAGNGADATQTASGPSAPRDSTNRPMSVFSNRQGAGVGPQPREISPVNNQASKPPPAPDPERGNWFLQQVQVHDAQLKSYLRGSFPTVRDVDDVVQESYLRVWRARLARPVYSAKSFLFQVARHLAIDAIRRDRVAPVDSLPDLAVLSVLDDGPGVVEMTCTREDIALLARAFDALPARCRQVMILRQIEGIPQKEIARRLGLSELTVQTHVVHGLRRLEAYMHRHAQERGNR